MGLLAGESGFFDSFFLFGFLAFTEKGTFLLVFEHKPTETLLGIILKLIGLKDISIKIMHHLFNMFLKTLPIHIQVQQIDLA
jgi:hypothetical protein